MPKPDQINYVEIVCKSICRSTLLDNMRIQDPGGRCPDAHTQALACSACSWERSEPRRLGRARNVCQGTYPTILLPFNVGALVGQLMPEVSHGPELAVLVIAVQVA